MLVIGRGSRAEQGRQGRAPSHSCSPSRAANAARWCSAVAVHKYRLITTATIKFFPGGTAAMHGAEVGLALGPAAGQQSATQRDATQCIYCIAWHRVAATQTVTAYPPSRPTRACCARLDQRQQPLHLTSYARGPGGARSSTLAGPSGHQ